MVDSSTNIETGNRVTEAIIRAFGALAQEHRLAVYRMLVVAGSDGLPAGTIAERLGIPASSLSFHLAQLVNAGLIGQRRAGRSVIYTPDYHAMARVIGFLTDNCSGGEGCGIVPGCGTPLDQREEPLEPPARCSGG